MGIKQWTSSTIAKSKRAMSGVLALRFTPAPDDRAVPESAIKNLFGRNVIE